MQQSTNSLLPLIDSFHKSIFKNCKRRSKFTYIAWIKCHWMKKHAWACQGIPLPIFLFSHNFPMSLISCFMFSTDLLYFCLPEMVQLPLLYSVSVPHSHQTISRWWSMDAVQNRYPCVLCNETFLKDSYESHVAECVTSVSDRMSSLLREKLSTNRRMPGFYKL